MGSKKLPEREYRKMLDVRHKVETVRLVAARRGVALDKVHVGLEEYREWKALGWPLVLEGGTRVVPFDWARSEVDAT